MNVVFVWWLLIVVIKIIYFTDANRITGNLCWSMPCMNGGSCFGSTYTYLCVCPVNYSGALCEKRLGICHESPCGNRGLCIETGLFSFECRCYFDYMGALCEEHVPKNDASVWSSLVPVHTRVLFDILQEAYRERASGRSGLRSHNDQVDFPGLLTTNDASSSLPDTTTTTTTKAKSDSITHQSETTEKEHVIQAEGIQLKNIFPQISTLSTSDVDTQSFTTQQDDYNNEPTVSTSITSDSMMQTKENISTTLSSLTTVENMMTVSIEQNQTNYSNITEDQESFPTTEQYNSIITSAPSEWSTYNSDNQIFEHTTELMENSTAQISNSTEFDYFYENTTSETTNETSSESTDDSSNQPDNNPLNTLEPTTTSISVPINPTLTDNKSIDSYDISKSANHQLLLKLCQQLLSHILPNVTSLSTSAAIEAALSLSSGSPSSGNDSADALLIWIKEQLSSTTSSPSTTTTTTTAAPTIRKKTTTTPTTRTISSTLPALLINNKKLSSISLQRVDMDDILHQMNNNVDGEN